MANFSYRVRQPGTKKVLTGQVEAATAGDANRLLHQQDYVVLALDLGESSGGRFSFKRHKVALKEKIIFTRQLGVMIKAGLPIIKALEALGEQSESRYFQTVVADLVIMIKGGQTLSKALQKYPAVFGEVYVAVIQAGEESGQLSEVLVHLAEQQEKDAAIIGKVRGALIYPAVILVALIGVIGLVTFYVLPSLKGVFKDLGGQLPLSTRLLFGASNFLIHDYWLLAIIIIGLYVLLRYLVHRPGGRYWADKIKLRLPIFGSLTKKLYMARFARTMAMLVKASLPILDSLKIVRKTINNQAYDGPFTEISRAVEAGKPLSAALKEQSIFPPMVYQLLSLGEESGDLEPVFSEVANFYETEVDDITKNIATLIEPIMIIAMGLGVAFVVVAVLGPIYGLVNKF
ncbi:MAG TPA: type II secretion system F family protein [Candidatus Saccharimonadales bacterium]|nr:type II secretion system F family protein [Candidatus Saccharimonadales bacterium]